MRKAYLIGHSARDFALQLGATPHEVVETMEAAVARAGAEAEPGDTVLLTPAAARKARSSAVTGWVTTSRWRTRPRAAVPSSSATERRAVRATSWAAGPASAPPSGTR